MINKLGQNHFAHLFPLLETDGRRCLVLYFLNRRGLTLPLKLGVLQAFLILLLKVDQVLFMLGQFTNDFASHWGHHQRGRLGQNDFKSSNVFI